MREIKFRGKRAADNEWVYGDLVHTIDDKIMIHFGNFSSVVIKDTIGQYTGLKDRNGKEIYEGDIVVCKDEKYIIKYLEKYTRFTGTNSRCVFAVFNLSISEIVGNIYDNPELLKEE